MPNKYTACIFRHAEMTANKTCYTPGCAKPAEYITMGDSAHLPTCEEHAARYARLYDIRSFSYQGTYPWTEEELTALNPQQATTKIPQRREIRKPRKQATK
jgi:hypothetical protein